jgi:hypothetical protein
VSNKPALKLLAKEIIPENIMKALGLDGLRCPAFYDLTQKEISIIENSIK